MNSKTHGMGWGLCLVLAGALVGSPGVLAEGRSGSTPVGVVLGQGSSLWLEGTSTMHDFESRTSNVTLMFARSAASHEPADPAGFESLVRDSAITGLEVEVPITSMRSGKSGLDRNMQKALRAEKFPSIRFHLLHYALKPDGAGRDTMNLEAMGTLNIAGRDRAATLLARAYRSPQGLWVEGIQSLLMSDFDIRPPTMMLGAVKVGDRVTVHYRLLVSPGNSGASPTSGRTN